MLMHLLKLDSTRPFQQYHIACFNNRIGNVTRFPGIKTGKGCINFRDKDDIPYSALKEVVTSAITSPMR